MKRIGWIGWIGATGAGLLMAACAGSHGALPGSAMQPLAQRTGSAPTPRDAGAVTSSSWERCVRQAFPRPTDTSGVSSALPCDPAPHRGLPDVAPPHVAAPPTGHTTAWGTLVDDPTDLPLPGYAVVLYPASPGCVVTGDDDVRCPAPLAIHAHTSRRGKFVLAGVPNGAYLLVIGSDSPRDARRPTIHDLVTLVGGLQRIDAPVLVREPAAAPPPPFQANLPAVPVPTVEQTILFRLGDLGAGNGNVALHCWQAFRRENDLPLGVADEWLRENETAVDEAANAYVAWGVPAYTPLLSSAADGSPFPPCPGYTDPTQGAYANQEALDPRTLWIGGVNVTAGSGAVSGLTEWKPDPRSVNDPLQGTGVAAWP